MNLGIFVIHFLNFLKILPTKCSYGNIKDCGLLWGNENDSFNKRSGIMSNAEGIRENRRRAIFKISCAIGQDVVLSMPWMQF